MVSVMVISMPPGSLHHSGCGHVGLRKLELLPGLYPLPSVARRCCRAFFLCHWAVPVIVLSSLSLRVFAQFRRILSYSVIGRLVGVETSSWSSSSFPSPECQPSVSSAVQLSRLILLLNIFKIVGIQFLQSPDRYKGKTVRVYLFWSPAGRCS